MSQLHDVTEGEIVGLRIFLLLIGLELDCIVGCEVDIIVGCEVDSIVGSPCVTKLDMKLVNMAEGKTPTDKSLFLCALLAT